MTSEYICLPHRWRVDADHESNEVGLGAKLTLEAVVLEPDQSFASLPLEAKTNLSSASSMAFYLCSWSASWHSPNPKHHLPTTPGYMFVVRGSFPPRIQSSAITFSRGWTGLGRGDSSPVTAGTSI